MSVHTIIAIPFLITALVLFACAWSSKHKAFLYAGIGLITAAFVNAVIGMSL